ncbi:N-6 DNA methylase [Luedemannella helvata]|uniref:N-6 DNA methylase n=1 Tax=Luedemannella helvata TaxID=349315 RepID=A0ABN2JVP7_9ACTN
MTEEPSTVIGDATLTASGIARLAGVGRAAVSNWRRRYADFPAPVGGTPASPYFDAREVDQWLRRQGKLRHASTEQWTWRHIETYQPAAQIGDALSVAGAYLLVRSELPANGDALLTPRQLVTRLRTLDRDLAARLRAVLPDEWRDQLKNVVQAVEQLAGEKDPETAFEYLHNQYVSSAQSMSGLAGTPDSVAEVMLTLTGVGRQTFDFTCGTGSILRMAAHKAVEAGTTTHCYGQEIKTQYALIALIRLWFVHRRAQRAGHQAAPAPAVHVGDSLLADAVPELRADVVVANFPFGIHEWGHDQLAYDARWAFGLPPRTEPELAWVQHALSHLAPGGTAVVLMPPAAAARPAGRRIRAELVRRGALRAVVALPAGLMAPAGIGLQVWVLTQPDGAHAHDARILFLDASHHNPPAALVGKVWREFESGDYQEVPGLHRVIAPIELVDERVDLTPQRHLPGPGEQPGDSAQTMARIGELERRLSALARALPNVQPVSATSLGAAPQASLSDLVKSGSITIRRIATPTRLTGVSTIEVAETDPLETAVQARPGDIVTSVVGQEVSFQVVPDHHEQVHLEPGVQVMSVDPTRLDPWFVAGVLSCAVGTRPASRSSMTGNSATRLDLRRFTIPVLSLHEQQLYGRTFRTLAEFQSSLGAAAKLGATVAREIRAGLNAGTLTPAE